MLRFLSITEVSSRLGVTRGTLASLASFPEPDAMIGSTRGWNPATIDAWQASRPGHGGRPRKDTTRLFDETPDVA